MTLLAENRVLITLTILLAALSVAVPAYAGQRTPHEYEVKAAFLYNFAKFVVWPKDAFPERESPIVIGVLGDDPFGPVLEEVIEGKTVNNRALAIRRFRRTSDVVGCHVLFISPSEGRRLVEIFGEINLDHVLTVGDCRDFAASGGNIGFYMEDKKVRIEVNLEAAERANLRISSKLLNVARVVGSEETAERR